MKLFQKTDILFSLCLTTAVASRFRIHFDIPFCVQVDVPQTEDLTVESGNYVISGCGLHTNSVAHLFQQLRGGIQLALQNPATSIVYKKFFAGVNPSLVNGILTKISEGGDIVVGGRSLHPTIVCANAHMPGIAKHLQACHNTLVQATATLGYQYVILCPWLFNLKVIPEATDCVGALGHDFYSTGQGLARNQMGIFLHELVDIYLAATPGFSPSRLKVYNLAAVLDLPSTHSVNNAANYVFYVASMIPLVISIGCKTFKLRDVDLMAKCKTFDPPVHRRPPERRLLGNSTQSCYAECNAQFELTP